MHQSTDVLIIVRPLHNAEERSPILYVKFRRRQAAEHRLVVGVNDQNVEVIDGRDRHGHVVAAKAVDPLDREGPHELARLVAVRQIEVRDQQLQLRLADERILIAAARRLIDANGTSAAGQDDGWQITPKGIVINRRLDDIAGSESRFNIDV